MTEIPLKPKNNQNTPETQKMTKIPPKPKKNQNTLETQRMTKIPLKPKKLPKYPLIVYKVYLVSSIKGRSCEGSKRLDECKIGQVGHALICSSILKIGRASCRERV